MVSRADANENFLRMYDIDRRSVFVGGVPVDTDEEEMIALFSEVGEVVNVDIVKRSTNSESPPGRFAATTLTATVGAHAFAFVEFSRADLPDLAVKKLVSFTRACDWPIDANNPTSTALPCATTRTQC